MAANPPTDDLRNIITSELTKVKAAGQTDVSIDRLIAYIETLPAPDDRDRHLDWTKHTSFLTHASWVEIFKSALEAGGTSIRF